MRVLVAGGRNYTDREAIYSLLDALHNQTTISTIINGGCTGADALAASWGRSRLVHVETYFADWTNHGRAAGPIRNRRMIQEGKPDMAILFPGGHGTLDMARQLRSNNVPTQVVQEPETKIL